MKVDRFGHVRKLERTRKREGRKHFHRLEVDERRQDDSAVEMEIRDCFVEQAIGLSLYRDLTRPPEEGVPQVIRAETHHLAGQTNRGQLTPPPTKAAEGKAERGINPQPRRTLYMEIAVSTETLTQGAVKNPDFIRDRVRWGRQDGRENENTNAEQSLH